MPPRTPALSLSARSLHSCWRVASSALQLRVYPGAVSLGVTAGYCASVGPVTWVLSRFSCVRLCATPWTAACQAPLSMGFSRQGYWSGMPFPPPGDLPDPGIKPVSLRSPVLAGGFFTTGTTCEGPLSVCVYVNFFVCISACMFHLHLYTCIFIYINLYNTHIVSMTILGHVVPTWVYV